MQPLEPYKTFAKIAFKSLSVLIRIALFLTFQFVIVYNLPAQSDNLITDHDTIPKNLSGDDVNVHDSLKIQYDSLFINELDRSDTIIADTLETAEQPREGALEDMVYYTAEDSMKISLKKETMYLYGNATVKYLDIELIANYIELNYAREEVFAKGSIDTSGQVVGTPVFTQGSQSFESDSMKYNFGSENGIIYHIVTQQGEGYLHSDKSKRHKNEHIHAYGNKYTTCDAEHPHFYLALKEAIIIPEDKIVAKASYFVLEDIPIKVLGLPFGFFPNTTRRSSGILFPSFGEERNRGFFLRDLGWYQVLGDYADFRILGDFYSKGSWGVETNLAYKYRYHFSGDFSFNYNQNKNVDDIAIPESKDYRLRWSHRQDAKANPTQNFSASVNFSSSEYEKYNSYSSQEYLTNQKSSSINYSKNWPGTPFNLAISGNASQNSRSKSVNMNLPTGSFNMSSIYPFRGKTGSGKYKWYENISLQYSSKFDNQIDTYDSVLFEQETWDNMRNAFQHNIPLSVNFKIGKLVTITPSMRYTGVLYSARTVVDSVVLNQETDVVEEYSRRVKEGSYAQAINPSIGVSFAPKLYGMFVSKKDDGYMEAVRHVISPSASFSFTPDMKKVNKNYYDSLFYTNSEGIKTYRRIYNPFEDEIYGPPSSNGKSGSLRLSLNNNLEMKVRPKNDTTGEAKKVVILENLNFSTSYSPWAEQFKWQDVSMVTGTKFFNKKMDLRVNGRFSPYAIDSIGKKIDVYYNRVMGGINFLRFTNITVTSGFTLKSKAGDKGSDSKEDQDQTGETGLGQNFAGDEMDFTPTGYTGNYVDFDIPWSLNVSYSWSWNRPGIKTTRTHTVNMSGDFSLTPRWKIGVRSGYDIEAKKITFTNLSIYRDLHCWQMSFSVIPFGSRASYSFTIQAKSSLLRDLKYEKKPNWYDNF